MKTKKAQRYKTEIIILLDYQLEISKTVSSSKKTDFLCVLKLLEPTWSLRLLFLPWFTHLKGNIYKRMGCFSSIVCFSMMHFPFSRYNFREYKEVFTGLEMCDWLTEVGLVHDRGEAVKYGRTLLIGRVIAHVKNEHHFHDLPYFYFFLDDEEAVLLSITENTWDVESDLVNLIIYLILNMLDILCTCTWIVS